MNKLLHNLFMYLILVGGIILFLLAIMWFTKGNDFMGLGMLVMAIVAESNYILHRQSMAHGSDKEIGNSNMW